MRFTCFRSQRNATGIFSKSEAALEQPRKVCAARLSRRKPKPPTEQPRESARGCEPSRTPSPRGCRGAERPTLRIVGNQNLHQNTPGELERAAALSTSNRGRRPARRKGCLPKGQASRFAWSPRVLIFSEGSLLPGEKIASLQIPRPEIRRISAESEKGWCGGESVPSAPWESSRGSQPSRLPIKRISRREIVSFSHRGWQWRGSLLPRPHTTL